MEVRADLIEPLFETAEAYGKTSFELLKLRSLDKTASVMSALISRLLLVFVLLVFILILNIGVAFWLGDLLGKNYYGFLAVAGFDGLIAIILYFSHKAIRVRIKNSVITQMFN